MFPRISAVKHKGKTYKYLRVVQNWRDSKGKQHQRVVANLGRLDQLKSGELDRLVEKLRRFCQGTFVLPREIQNKETACWGPVLVARHLWEELGLDAIIQELCQSSRHTFNVADRAFVLVCNRLVEPTSEHGLARWLEHTYVCDREGRRYRPQWKHREAVREEGRVKVEWEQLKCWYHTLDAVYGKKKEIEKELYMRLRDLFSMKVDLVFYDLTSIYFQGREPRGEMRRHGHSRDGKPRNVQVVLGLVMVGGFPIAGHIFEGNRSDKATVKDVVADLEERFEIREIIFVGDKGTVGTDTLLALVQHKYILGHRGRRDREAREWLGKLSDNWLPCGEGTRVQEVDSGQKGIRVVLVESEERKEYEERLRKRSMERAEAHLKKVKAAVEKGRLKKPEKIGARAGVALRKDKGYRYFSYRIEGEGSFEYYVDHDKMEAELVREGRYILTTNLEDMSPEDMVSTYKELSDIEEGFRELKDVIEARPVYHRTDERIEAHLFIAQLAFLLLRQLRHHLKGASSWLSTSEALAAVKSLGVAELDLNGERCVTVSCPKRDAKHVLSVLGISDIYPPKTGGPNGAEKAVLSDK